MPFTFNNMISYLSYLASRDELKEAIDVLSYNTLRIIQFLNWINLRNIWK